MPCSGSPSLFDTPVLISYNILDGPMALRLVAKIWRCDICGREERQELGEPRPKHPECGRFAEQEARRQLEEHQGPYYQKWLDAMRKVQPRIPEEREEEEE